MKAKSAVVCDSAGRRDLVAILTDDGRTVVGYTANYGGPKCPILTGRAVDVTRAAGRFDPYDAFYLANGPAGMPARKLATLRRDVFAALPMVSA